MYQRLLGLEEDIFKVIANQKRLEIIQLLSKRELNVTEMAEMLAIRQPNLSQHLTIMRQHKIVTITKKGREVYYTLADHNVARAVDLIFHFLQTQYDAGDEISADKLFPIVTDPVCGMRLSASEAFDSVKYEQRTYYFCASGCTANFNANPHKYQYQEHSSKVKQGKLLTSTNSRSD